LESVSSFSPLKIPAEGRAEEGRDRNNQRLDLDKSYKEALEGLAEGSVGKQHNCSHQINDNKKRHTVNEAKKYHRSRDLQDGGDLGPRGNRTLKPNKFRGASKTYDIFLGRVFLGIEVEEIERYIKEEIKVEIKGISLIDSIHEQKYFNSFKVTVDSEIRDYLIDPNKNLWPKNVVVRKYFAKRTSFY
jgi:hypothetical protein